MFQNFRNVHKTFQIFKISKSILKSAVLPASLMPLFTASLNCSDSHPEFTREQFKVAGKKHFQSVDLKTWDTTFGGHANHDGCDDDDGDDTLLMGLMKKADILATEGKV